MKEITMFTKYSLIAVVIAFTVSAFAKEREFETVTRRGKVVGVASQLELGPEFKPTGRSLLVVYLSDAGSITSNCMAPEADEGLKEMAANLQNDQEVTVVTQEIPGPKGMFRSFLLNGQKSHAQLCAGSIIAMSRGFNSDQN